MTFKHGKFSDSPVMREFERVAIKRGLAKPDEMVKVASINLEPSNDLFSDIFKLAQSLRDRGFEKQANELEDNIINYKTAETHLYRAIDEDGDDLLEFAHPKGSVKVNDAEDKNGEVEDLLDQHKKIVDVVNKKPTGKYASLIEDLAIDLGIKKKAELNDFGKMDVVESAARNINAHYKDGLLREFSAGGMYFYYYDTNAYEEKTTVFGIGIPDQKVAFPILVNGSKKDGKVENAFLKFYLKANNITDEMFADFLANKVDPNTIFSQDNINIANSNLKTRYNNVIKKIKSLPFIPIKPNDQNYNESIEIANKLKEGVNGLFDEFSWFDFKGILANSPTREDKVRKELVPAILTQADNYIAAVKDKFAQKTQQPEQAVLLSDWWANNVAGKFDRLKDAALNINQDKLANEFMAIANVVRNGANKPFSETYNALKNIDQSNAAYDTINKLDDVAMKWENYFKTQKKASTKSELIKEALGDPPITPAATTAPIKAQPHTNAPRTVSPKPVKPVNMSEKEYDTVLAMQNSLNTLAKALLNPETKEKIKQTAGLNEDETVRLSSILSGTGRGTGNVRHTDAPDGQWGPNTSKALAAAQALQDRLVAKNPQLASKEKFVAESQFNKGFSEKDVVDRANNNRNLINTLLSNVGAGHLIPGNVNEYDKLPRADYSDTSLMQKVGETGDVSLGQNDLNSFDTLYNHLTTNGLVPRVSFDRTSNEMKEGLPSDVWENIVHFLRFRAYQKMKQNAEDTVAKSYASAIDKLYMKLKPFMDEVAAENKSENGIINPYGKKYQILGPKDFTASDSSKTVNHDKLKPGDTKTISAPGKGGSAGDGIDVDYVAEYSKDLIQQPIAYNINLRNLAQAYPQQMKYYSNDLVYGRLLARKLQINVQEFRQDPAVIADNILRDPEVSDLPKIWPTMDKVLLARLMKDPNGVEAMKYIKDAKLRLFAKIIMAMRHDLMDVIDKWEDNMNNIQMDPRAVQANNSAWNAWSKAFSQLLNRITSSINQVGAGNYYSY